MTEMQEEFSLKEEVKSPTKLNLSGGGGDV